MLHECIHNKVKPVLFIGYKFADTKKDILIISRVFSNAQNWHYWHHCQLCIPTYLIPTNSLLLLPPANVVCEGYVFTGVCLSTGGGWVSQDALQVT